MSGWRPRRPRLARPEGAVVAAFERIDLIASDAMAEIVANAVEPDRALSDHAFANRLASRAGTAILIGPGPLVVAPDLASGVPSDPATRAGRALALQLLGVHAGAWRRARRRTRIIVGALTPWLTDEPSPGARAIAEVAVRRVLFDGHPLGFVEPSTTTERSALWPFVEAAAAAHAGNVALVLRSADGGTDEVARRRSGLPAQHRWSRPTSRGRPAQGPLTGVALDHARGMVAAAVGDARAAGRRGLADGRRRPAEPGPNTVGGVRCGDRSGPSRSIRSRATLGRRV